MATPDITWFPFLDLSNALNLLNVKLPSQAINLPDFTPTQSILFQLNPK